MSLEQLEALDMTRTFEATHRFEDLGMFHVPFDHLTESNSTEASLKAMAERGGKVVLAGPSGAGKSSVIASVLGPLAENLSEEIVPLRIPVAALNAETATEPRAFAQHLVRTVIRYSTEILSEDERQEMRRAAADATSTKEAERARRWTVGAPKLIMDGGFASEVKSGAEELNEELTAGGAIDAVARLVAIFRAHGREPYFVIDDSDRWIRIEGTDLLEVANAFFRRIVPMLAREIGCGFVFAAHDEYLTLESYRSARELCSQVIHLPTPPHPGDAIFAILDRRIGLAGVNAMSAELFDQGAIDALVERYVDNRSLRGMLSTVDRATQLACTERIAPITSDLIQTALADLA